MSFEFDDYDKRFNLDFPANQKIEVLRTHKEKDFNIEEIGNDPRTLEQKRRDWVNGKNVRQYIQ